MATRSSALPPFFATLKNSFVVSFQNRERFMAFFKPALLFAVFGVVSTIIYTSSIAEDGSGGMQFYVLLMFILQFLVGVLFALMFTRFAMLVLHDKKVASGAMFRYGMEHFGRGVRLTLRNLWYVMKWPLLIMVVTLIFFAIFGVATGETLRDYVKLLVTVAIVPLLVSIVVLFVQSLKTTFSFVHLVDQDLSPKEALSKSIGMVKLRFFRVAWYVVCGVVIITFLFNLLWPFLTQFIFGNEESVHYFTLFVGQLLSQVGAVIALLFVGQLYLKLK